MLRFQLMLAALVFTLTACDQAEQKPSFYKGSGIFGSYFPDGRDLLNVVDLGSFDSLEACGVQAENLEAEHPGNDKALWECCEIFEGEIALCDIGGFGGLRRNGFVELCRSEGEGCLYRGEMLSRLAKGGQ